MTTIPQLMKTIPQLMGEIAELERDVLYYSEKIDKATQLYLKELSEKGKVDDLACKMFNVLEGNVK